MTRSIRRRCGALAVTVSIVSTGAGPALALQVRPPTGRFEGFALTDPAGRLDVATTPLTSLAAADGWRGPWEAFRAARGASWSVYLDRRSGAPLYVEGAGIAMPGAKGGTIDTLGASLRAFIAENRALLLADDAELVLDRDASGELNPDVWQIVFSRAVAGVPVAGERYVFTVGHGNLMSFGTPRWSRIDTSPVPDIDGDDAQGRLAAYMKLTAADTVTLVEKPALQIIAVRAAPASAAAAPGPYSGPMGAGYGSALVWRIALRVDGDPGTWVGWVDAHTGAIRSLADDTKYARVKGGIYPISNDQNCPDGCEQPGFPMPFANVTINAVTQQANTLGTFNCTPGGALATTALAGPYVRVDDVCGTTLESVTCNGDIDVQQGTGTDCAAPAGASAGNTHAARSSFYHLNRIAEHARTWLPTRSWLTNQLRDTVNLNQSCNAYWDGIGVNFFKSSGSCNNTGEIAGVFLHEWGHGLDQNDGGGFDSPSEAYGDITSFMQTHSSCIGRGFRKFGNCGGYGNACLSCSGVRDQDWDQHVGHTPSTPAGFAAVRCSGGGGPCGREEHCEALVSGEAMWDLAARDLPASGLDPASAWQVADKLWYKSRLGSGGDAYNCSLPSSDGCSANSWFNKLRAVDDDDGNLANGTPHAAAIFAAFDRHAIACGAASDPSNQSSSTCPAIAAATLQASAGPTSAALTWTPVANSIGFRIMRSDAGCQAATTQRSIVTGTTFNDTLLINGLTLSYSIQAIAPNGACDGPLSNCVAVTPQSGAGTVKLDSANYACSGSIGVTVTDGNLGADTATVAFTSTTETTPENVTITRVAPGSATYAGSIPLTAAAAAHDGVLSVATGSTISARYVDANDGAGHFNQQRVTTATADCGPAPGVAKPVGDGGFGTPMRGSRADLFGSTIELSWDVATCVSTNHHVLYGDLAGVAAMSPQGAVCNLGATGSATWSGVPSADLWFVVVGGDGGSTEATWGTDGIGGERGGAAASGFCGMSSRDNAAVCP